MKKFLTAFALLAALVGVVTYDMAEHNQGVQDARTVTHHGPAF